jgi:hypothetical protein
MPVATIEVRNNLKLTFRERGKIVGRREGHNIWLDLGREYLAKLMSFKAAWAYEREDRIKYMGLGIGGTRQLALAVANAAPMTDYPGTNLQTDTDPTITKLERPVRVTGGSGAPVGTDVWLGTIQTPPVYPTATSVTYTRLFALADISYGTYLTVPLSEILLCTDAADPNVYNNTGVAYDTFDTFSKTGAFELEVAWTVRF